VEIIGDVFVFLVGPLGYLQRADFDILEDGLSYGSIQVWVGYGTVKTSVKKSIGTTRTWWRLAKTYGWLSGRWVSL